MSMDSFPKSNPQEPSKAHPESATERKEYDLARFHTAIKVVAAIDAGFLSALKEDLFTKEDVLSQRAKDAGRDRRGYLLGIFAEKAVQGYQAMGKVDEIIDDKKFEDISGEYEEKIAQAPNDEERAALKKELEDIASSRNKKLGQEKKDKSKLGQIFGIIGDIFKKQ